MRWNNRVVHIKDDCFAMREVYYDDDGNLLGHATPCMVGDTIEELQHQVSRWVTAAMQPVLDSDAFPSKEIDEDELVVGRIEIIENAIHKMANELRHLRHKTEDDISRHKFNKAEDERIEAQLKPNWDVKEGAYAAEEAAWPNWGNRPDGFDGPGGAE